MRTFARIGVALLVACGSPQGEVVRDETAGEGHDEHYEAIDVEQEEAAVENAPAQQTGELSVRVELEHPIMRAGADPSVDIDARLDAIVYVRNHGPSERELTVPIPATHELEWRVTDGSGTGWELTFLPPPVPRPGGPPTTTVRIEPGGEAQLADLYGVSGFRRAGAPPDAWTGTPPPGTYTIVVSGFRLGGESLTAPPVQLVVR